METKLKRTKQIALISGIFTCLVALLLVLNYVQISTNKPLESKALTLLVEKLSAEPDNHQLTEDVRQLDLLARKAYFNSIWQINTGALLLILGAVVFVWSLRAHLKLKFRIEPPIPAHVNNKLTRNKTQRWIALTGILFFVAASLSALFSVNYLKSFDSVAMDKTDAQNVIVQTEIAGSDSLSLPTDSLSTSDSSALNEALIPLNETTLKQQYNGFRGAWGSALTSMKNIPTSWNGSTKKNVLWKTAIPLSGKNSPVIWGDRIFVTGATASKRVVYCFDRNTGVLLWSHAADKITGSPARSPQTTDDTGLAAPTVTIDGQRVFALFGNGDIVAVDLSGKRVWARNLGTPDNHYGHSSSLLTWGGKVFVQYDTQSGCNVMALNTETGKTVWKTPRTNEISWSSPILAKVGGKIQLILQSSPTLAGYDINSGKQLWSVECMSGEVGPSPVYGGGLVYAANEYAKLVAVNPKTGNIVWENTDKLPEVSSPAYFNGHVFVATTYAVLASIDAATGQLEWEYEAKAPFYSSPVIADGKLYIFDTNGKAYIFAPGKTAKLLATADLGENVYSTPAFSQGRIYVRGSKSLFCIGTK